MSKTKMGRPAGSSNTTGWKTVALNLRPAVLTEVDRQAKRAGLSRSGWVNSLIAEHLESIGKGKVVEKAEAKTFKKDEV